MIDTWARHLAAVGEARRLIRMVLDNNPAFQELSAAPGHTLTDATPAAGLLAADVHYQAYVHLNAAFAALRPEPAPCAAASDQAPSLSARISEIVPAVQRVPESDELSLIRLRQRLRYVLEGPPHVEVPALAVAADWASPGEEARIAIVHAGVVPG